ncbi:cell division protein FtsA [Candidatus Endowatersipora endosymbiont of Watersipora subatra]|uniref:cell division protein FtsA n=1 Tax=Candidatus Endowatersipora endosymbiont of Watersipora subatra TaxID=3077946 RepID=UPI00312C99BB
MSLFNPSDLIPRIKRLSGKRTTTLSVVDIGSTKICCVIAKLKPYDQRSMLLKRSHSIQVIGFGYQKSQGVKAGVIVDMIEVEKSIRLAVHQAEQSAGLTVDSMMTTVSARGFTSHLLTSGIMLKGNEVQKQDIREVLTACHFDINQERRAILHAIPITYSLDHETGIHNPEGLVGRKLSVNMHVVEVDIAPLNNIESCLNRSHLSLDAIVAEPYASGLASLMDDEMRMGCACIDMGGGTTTTSIFLNGDLVFIDSIAVGGNHATMDLAKILSIPVADAERIKILRGSVLLTQAGDRDFVSVPVIGEDTRIIRHQVTQSHISKIIRSRVEETFEMVRDRINQSCFANAVGKRLILTGGASQLLGVGELASRILGSSARIGRPLGISAMPKIAKSPAFSACFGMLIYPQISHLEYIPKKKHIKSIMQPLSESSFRRFSEWFRESF